MIEGVGSAALEVRGLSKDFGGLAVLRDVTLAVPHGEVRAIIGPNGAGKTTLINVVSGVHPASAGSVRLGRADVTGLAPFEIARLGLARTFQIASLFLDLSVLENVRVAAHAGWRFRPRRAAQLSPGESLALLGLDHLASQQASGISHGDQRLLEIAVAIATDPVLLLLDEPTAGMSPAETHRFIELVNQRLRKRYTLVIVEHDMHVVMNTADVISVLAMGRILAEGEPAAIRAEASGQEAYLGSAYA